MLKKQQACSQYLILDKDGWKLTVFVSLYETIKLKN